MVRHYKKKTIFSKDDEFNYHCHWNRSYDDMIAVICATCAGMTIVLSRSVNGYLSQKVGAYQSTFFNYFTGLFMSLVFFNNLRLFSYTRFSINRTFRKSCYVHRRYDWCF